MASRQWRGIFRLQALPFYVVSGEEEALASYEAGVVREPLTDEDVAYAKSVGDVVASGTQWTNVHVLPSPLTAYVRMMIDWVYPRFHDLGVDVRFVSRDGAVDSVDFYLFDDVDAVVIDFNDRNEFLAQRRVSQAELPKLIGIRDRIVARSISLEDVLRELRSGSMR
jgi:hypothetical protein